MVFGEPFAKQMAPYGRESRKLGNLHGREANDFWRAVRQTTGTPRMVGHSNERENIMRVNMAYRPMTNEQKSFVANILTTSSKLLGKWAGLSGVKKRGAFRHGILTGNPDLSAIREDLREEFLDDVETILVPKRMVFAELDGRNVETAIVEGYIPLLEKWSKGDDEYLSELICKILQNIYYFDVSKSNLSTYIGIIHKTLKRTFAANNSIVRTPLDWGVISYNFDRASEQNQGMSYDDLIEKLGITKRQKENMDSFKRFSGMRQMSEMLGGIKESSAETPEVSLVASSKFNLDEVKGLSEVQTECLKAFMKGKRGWQSELSRRLINPRTKKPYSKMAISLSFKRAIETIKKSVGESNE